MLLSIVTIHLNAFEGLRKTYRSLAKVRSSAAIEWIVIDGGSKPLNASDNEIFELTRNHSDKFSSEPDQGIYDAMNKGTERAEGAYVLYLNAGDELHPEFNPKAMFTGLGENTPAMIWGTCHELYANGDLVKVKNRSPALAWYGMPVNHQNVLFRRDALGCRPYDTRYDICADYDLVSRILKCGGIVLRTRMPIAIFQRGGINHQNLIQALEEESELRRKHHGVPKTLSTCIKRLKMVNAKISQIPMFRRLLRKWV